MKKIQISFWRLVVPLALLLPLMVPIACTTDAGIGSEEGPRPLVFKAVSDDVSDEPTRGEQLNFMSGTFGLLASQYTGSWGYGHEMNFMYNEPVWGSGTEWQTSRGYFAPDASYNLKFFAYFPHCENVSAGTTDPIVMSEADIEGNPSFVYTMPQDAEEQQDLMYAISDEVHANAQGRMDTVRLQFHHLLTAVSIATGESSEEGYIRRVRLTDIYYRGTFDYGNTAITTTTSYKRDCWADLDLKSQTSSGFTRADREKTFLLLPQRNSNGTAILHANASLVVEYEASGHTYTFTQNLSALKDALATPGRNILLRLSVTSVKRMTISATITDWGQGATFNGADSDQPTIDLGTAISDWETVDSNNESTTFNFSSGPETTNP